MPAQGNKSHVYMVDINPNETRKIEHLSAYIEDLQSWTKQVTSLLYELNYKVNPPNKKMEQVAVIDSYDTRDARIGQSSDIIELF